MIDIADIGILNDGESRLARVADALEKRRLPEQRDAEALIDAVQLLRVMAREGKSAQDRHKWFLKKIGLTEGQGRKNHDDDIGAQMLARKQARAYWGYRLFHGVSKAEARRLAASELQLSDEFPDGKPSESSIRDNVKRYPREGIQVFSLWVRLGQPTDEEKQKARAEIDAALEKADRKT